MNDESVVKGMARADWSKTERVDEMSAGCSELRERQMNVGDTETEELIARELRRVWLERNRWSEVGGSFSVEVVQCRVRARKTAVSQVSCCWRSCGELRLRG